MNVADIPRQMNGYDCGVFVCYYLEFPENVQKFRKEQWISKEERCQLCLRILKSTNNQKKEHVYQRAERWQNQEIMNEEAVEKSHEDLSKSKRKKKQHPVGPPRRTRSFYKKHVGPPRQTRSLYKKQYNQN